jgi:hypothetical protein
LAAGCGSNKNGFQSPDGGASSGGGSDSGLIAPDGSLVGDGSLVCTGVHCSSDLHSIVDCNDHVLQTCPTTQACVNAMCIDDPCQGASANQSAIGCEYYAVVPDARDILGLGFTDALDDGGCYAVFIANTWGSPATITVNFGSQTLDPNTFTYVPSGSGKSITYTPIAGGQIPVGQVAILFLNQFGNGLIGDPNLNLSCPKSVTPAITTADAATHGTGLGTAFHITTSVPVTAYDVYPYGGGSSAVASSSLLLPTSAWGTNYIAVDAYPYSMLSGGSPFMAFVAEADGTTITILPTANIPGSASVAGTAQNVPHTYNLDKGQVLQFTQGSNAGDLTGSVVQSNNPISALGGQTCMNIDVNTCCCDTGHQQIPPVRALGSEYVAVRYRNRWSGVEESPPWRLVGAANGTTLTYDPPTPPPGAPTTLNLGQSVEFDTNGPFTVSSQDAQHPFYAASFMTGAYTFPMAGTPDGGAIDGRGDPEFVNIIPPLEFLSDYVFFTDPTYPETNLVVVRAKVNGAFADVTLDCLGTLSGWMDVGSAGKYQYTRVDLVTGDFAPQGGCDNGRHEIKSANPFGITVWGWGSAASGGFYSQFVSYAYPGGQSVAPINTVVVPPMAQ